MLYSYAGRDEIRRLTSEKPPITRRRMTPPTPMQISYTSFERKQGSFEEEGRGWNARDRTIIARTKQFLERSYIVKVRAEELEGFLRPEDVEWISGES